MASWQSAWARPLRTARPTLWPCASHVLRPARTPVTGMGRPARGRAAGLSTPRYVVKISPNSRAESASRREGHAEIHWEEKESVDSQASRRGSVWARARISASRASRAASSCWEVIARWRRWSEGRSLPAWRTLWSSGPRCGERAAALAAAVHASTKASALGTRPRGRLGATRAAKRWAPGPASKAPGPKRPSRTSKAPAATAPSREVRSTQASAASTKHAT
mmetsp:Transcript_31597/g.100694  ORF Transcript_31597/g.100694 Transcript_31597/m.100694 type:complete len:222 (-) Transcript_31597:2925-3590(-)